MTRRTKTRRHHREKVIEILNGMKKRGVSVFMSSDVAVDVGLTSNEAAMHIKGLNGVVSLGRGNWGFNLDEIEEPTKEQSIVYSKTS